MENTGFFASVYEVLRTVPRGRVVTYGQIARAIGAPRMARQVGYAPHVNPKPGIIPCHRVVGTSGSLTGYAGGVDKKAALLKLERADMSNFFIPKKGTAL